MALSQKQFYTAEDYWNLPEGQRAELIDGQIYSMAPPSRLHQELVSQFTKIIGNYIDSCNGCCKVYPAPFAVNLDGEDWVEPDISVICAPNKLTDRGCSGAPDWIIEIISPSDPESGLIYKLNLYARAGVREY